METDAQNEATSSTRLALSTKSVPSDLLLIIFIHGFKGTDTTFGDFPQRLQHVLTESIEDVTAECIIFPVYETKGELKEAVIRFADWLTTLTVEREVAHGSGGGAGKAKIVLCGHSMGGLLAADTLLEIINSRPDKKAPVWPKIIACIAFDTPYLGISPFVFKNSANKAVEYVNTARTVASSVFGSFAGLGATQAATPPRRAIGSPPAPASKSAAGSWGSTAFAFGGALLAGAAAGTAYYKRDELTTGYNWATDHMKYVGSLWDENTSRNRVEKLIEFEREFGTLFRIFYTLLPPSPPEHRGPRSFVVLPSRSSPFFNHFVPARNTLATDEIQAHVGMFGAASNDGYYHLGLETAKYIREAVLIARGVMESPEQESAAGSVAGSAMTDAMRGMTVREEKVTEQVAGL